MDVKTTKINQKRIERNELLNTRSELDENEKSGLQVKKDTQRVERSQQEPTGAAVASAVLQDIGIINEDKSSIIDNKIRRARGKKREGILETNQNSSLPGLFFDERKDETLKMEDGRRRKIREQHITLIKMPESVYLTHVCPESGTSSNIRKYILEYFDKSQITTDYLRVIGCDGTNVNVGKYSEIIANLEKYLDRPSQWFICQLLDFNIIELNIPALDESVRTDLSTDQKYLYDICDSISKGTVDENLSTRSPEPPLTMGLPEEVLNDIVKNPATSMLFSEIKSYPCHTQAVEWAVKIVTEASAAVCGGDNRDGVIRAKLESHRIMPSFGSKQDYKLN
ncbi:unnamed protein product [Psylliodes chrysocephalus]|uniref:Uncharacterized protein n=1 Tax=Psylliodes chrysocephalus TaxID=3402493 RepID=A0A9P0CJ91_9CUCU|nr:unnamed protein product [Psylliodes chrysocephala]